MTAHNKAKCSYLFTHPQNYTIYISQSAFSSDAFSPSADLGLRLNGTTDENYSVWLNLDLLHDRPKAPC